MPHFRGRRVENGAVESGLLPDLRTRLLHRPASRGSHARDVEVFNGHNDAAGGELLGQGVEVGDAALGDAVVDDPHAPGGLASAGRSFRRA